MAVHATCRQAATRVRWERQIAVGIVAICPVTEREILHTARSPADRDELVDLLAAAFCRVSVPDRAFTRASAVQAELTSRGAQIREVTGQGMSWLAPA